MFLSREDIRVWISFLGYTVFYQLRKITGENIGKVMDNDDLKGLLNSYFSHKVELRKEAKQEALAVWQEAVMEILQRAQAKDSEHGRFKLKRLNTGSYYENAKVKEPNEFDLMLQLENYMVYPIVHDSTGYRGNLNAPPGKLDIIPTIFKMETLALKQILYHFLGWKCGNGWEYGKKGPILGSPKLKVTVHHNRQVNKQDRYFQDFVSR